MNTIERIRRLARNYHDYSMNPLQGNLHDCLCTLDMYANIVTGRVVRVGGAPQKVFTGGYKYDTHVGERVRQHERHAGFIPAQPHYYHWLGALAESEVANAPSGRAEAEMYGALSEIG